MFNIFKKHKAKPYIWKKEHTRLWSSLVPADGQADTLQGELIRIAGKLTDQAFRNGNMNWDADHERMWRFVGKHLDDPVTFTAEERGLIRVKIEEIIRDNETPDLSGDSCSYYFISEKVVDWCMAHPTPIPHKKDETLKRRRVAYPCNTASADRRRRCSPRVSHWSLGEGGWAPPLSLGRWRCPIQVWGFNPAAWSLCSRGLLAHMIRFEAVGQPAASIVFGGEQMPKAVRPMIGRKRAKPGKQAGQSPWKLL